MTYTYLPQTPCTMRIAHPFLFVILSRSCASGGSWHHSSVPDLANLRSFSSWPEQLLRHSMSVKLDHWQSFQTLLPELLGKKLLFGDHTSKGLHIFGDSRSHLCGMWLGLLRIKTEMSKAMRWSFDAIWYLDLAEPNVRKTVCGQPGSQNSWNPLTFKLVWVGSLTLQLKETWLICYK